MHALGKILAFAGLVASAYATTGEIPHLVVHETAPRLGAEWTLHSKTSPNKSINLAVALAHPHEHYLARAYEISDPSSQDYGKHLSAEELANALPDYTDAAEPVVEWLNDAGIKDISISDEWVRFSTTVGRANTLLNANFSAYALRNSHTELRTLSYSIPSYLVQQIDFIYPTVHFMDFKPRNKPSRILPRTHATGIDCTISVCPSQIKELYNIDYIPPDNKSGSRIGVGGFLEQYINATDVTTFLKKFGLKDQKLPYEFSIQTVNNGINNQSQPGSEASLDVEYVAAFTDPLGVVFYSTLGRPPTLKQPGSKPVPSNESSNEPYSAWLQFLASEESPPQVLSVSYSDSEYTVPEKYAKRVCNMYGRLALRGVSVIQASGDGGATGAIPTSSCPTSSGKGHSFEPSFPASCHWVTSVGATTADTPPYAASYSSGGFSNYFPIPEYQRAAVTAYQERLHKPKGFYNKSGRGIPDVSLLGDNFLIVSHGVAAQIGGTSASTPVFAAMIALINDKRLRSGKPTLGYLNPVLYSDALSQVFTDVTRGSTYGCSYQEGGQDVTVRGYAARKGWDAATGLGAPDFQKLMAALL